MGRLSIEVTPEQHKRLKAVAALQGKTIKDYVLGRVLPPFPDMGSMPEDAALRKLEDFLEPRIESARRGEFSPRSVEQIFEDVWQDQK